MRNDIKCPRCQTPIHFDLAPLLKGEAFECPNCHSRVSLAPKSRPIAAEANARLEELRRWQEWTRCPKSFPREREKNLGRSNDRSGFNTTKMEKELLSMAQQFTGLPMEELIGGSLNVPTKANVTMSLALTKFLQETCFNEVKTTRTVDGKDVERASYKPVMIEMSLERGVLTPITDKNGNPATETKRLTTSFYLPLLAILPINSPGMDNVDISFEMEMKSSYPGSESGSEETETKGDGSSETES